MRRSVWALASVLVWLGGCATATYSPPTASPVVPNQRTYAASFDDTWEALIDYASSAFFSISTFERASGLMTLNFGSDAPARYVNCGQIAGQANGVDFDMPYAMFLAHGGATLNGRMNLLARREPDGSTSVRVNARYIFTAPPVANAPGVTFSFDGGSSSTVAVPMPIAGTPPTRTCSSSGYAEMRILEGIERALSGRRR